MRDAIDSALAQTYPNIEILVVNSLWNLCSWTFGAAGNLLCARAGGVPACDRADEGAAGGVEHMKECIQDSKMAPTA